MKSTAMILAAAVLCTSSPCLAQSNTRSGIADEGLTADEVFNPFSTQSTESPFSAPGRQSILAPGRQSTEAESPFLKPGAGAEEEAPRDADELDAQWSLKAVLTNPLSSVVGAEIPLEGGGTAQVEANPFILGGVILCSVTRAAKKMCIDSVGRILRP